MLKDKITFYHATSEKNIPSISEKGLMPRSESICEREIDRILAEYGLKRKDVPESIWGKPMERCKETAGKVYLTSDKDFAKANCLAGLEMEYELRAGVHSLHEEDTTPEAIIGEIQCKCCEVEVPLEVIKERTPEGWRAAERSMIRFFSNEHPNWSQEKVEVEARKQLFKEVTFDKVPPEWVKSCENSFKGHIIFPFPIKDTKAWDKATKIWWEKKLAPFVEK